MAQKEFIADPELLEGKPSPWEVGLEIWSSLKGGSSAGATRLWRAAREHPMPMAVVGLGLGWLALESRGAEAYDGRVREAFSQAGAKVSDATGWTREHAVDLGHQVAEKAGSLRRQAKTGLRRARIGFWQTMEEKPLVVGAAALALGLVAGLAFPSTEKEDEILGGTRDRLLDEVKEAGQQALERGKQVAEDLVERVRDEVHA